MRSQIELHEACSVTGSSRCYGASGAIQVSEHVAVAMERRVNDDAIAPWTCRNVVRHEDFLRVQNT
jgi:hypothetical protein